MRKAFASALLATLATAALAVPASAATPSISLSVNDASITEGSTVSFTGTARGVYVKNSVRLQVRKGSSWSYLKSDGLNYQDRYLFKVRPTDGRFTYRVVGTLKSGKTKSSPLRTVTVKPTDSELERVRTAILDETNRYRKSQGLAPLKPMSGLDSVAQRWTQHMAATGDFSHNPNVGGEIPKNWRGWGENIAAGYDYTSVTRAWWESPGHRANMLGSYNYIGIGYALNSDGQPYYTQNFAKY